MSKHTDRARTQRSDRRQQNHVYPVLLQLLSNRRTRIQLKRTHIPINRPHKRNIPRSNSANNSLSHQLLKPINRIRYIQIRKKIHCDQN